MCKTLGGPSLLPVLWKISPSLTLYIETTKHGKCRRGIFRGKVPWSYYKWSRQDFLSSEESMQQSHPFSLLPQRAKWPRVSSPSHKHTDSLITWQSQVHKGNLYRFLGILQWCLHQLPSWDSRNMGNIFVVVLHTTALLCAIEIKEISVTWIMGCQNYNKASGAH